MARCPFCKEEINELKMEALEGKVGLVRLNEWDRIYFHAGRTYSGKETYYCPKCEALLPIHNEVEAEAFLRGLLRIVPKEDIPKKKGKLGQCFVDSEDRPYQVLRKEEEMLILRRAPKEVEMLYRELDERNKEQLEIIRLS